MSPKHSIIPLKIYYYLLAYNQICLNPIVDDCHPQIGKNKINKSNKQISLLNCDKTNLHVFYRFE
jgi:hypothetical protein